MFLLRLTEQTTNRLARLFELRIFICDVRPHSRTYALLDEVKKKAIILWRTLRSCVARGLFDILHL